VYNRPNPEIRRETLHLAPEPSSQMREEEEVSRDMQRFLALVSDFGWNYHVKQKQ